MQKFCEKARQWGRCQRWCFSLLLMVGLATPAAFAQATKNAGTFQFTADTYYGTPSEMFPPTDDPALQRFSLLGVRLTVTRVGGSSGRVLVDYTGGAGGTLIFDDHEQSKSIVATAAGTFALSNPRLDMGESTNTIVAPTLGTLSSAEVVIHDVAPPDPANVVISFERSNYRVSEDGTGNVNPGETFDITIFVNRAGAPDATDIAYRILTAPLNRESNDDRRNNGFPLDAGSDYATPLPLDNRPYGRSADFFGDSGTLSWGQNDFDPKPITLTITNDNLVEFNEDIWIELIFDPEQTEIRVPSPANTTRITILHDDFPAGSVDPNHNPDYNFNTDPQQNSNPGANGVVYSTVVQPDGKTLIGGSFTAFNSATRNRIARLNADGSNDGTFDPGTGANAFVTSLDLDNSGRILAVGGFTSFNGAPNTTSIVRLNSNGSVDGTFSPGAGADGTIWCIAVQSDGKILIGGEFTTFNVTNSCNHIARLNADGSVDATFNPGVGPDGVVNAIAVTAAGQIVIGGEFSAVSGSLRSGVARLNANGSLDNGFNPGTGAGGGPVHTLALQGNGQVLVGGGFTTMDQRSSPRLARLNSDGSLDTSFNIGSGANNTVYAITLQNDGRIMVGGIFTSFNQTRRLGLTRLHSYGTVDTTFLDTAYNDFAGLINRYDNEPENFVFSIAMDGANVMIGGGFKYIGGGRWHQLIQPERHDEAAYTRAAYRVRSNVARLLGGETPGPGAIEFIKDSYNVDENSAQLYVSIMRTNGNLGPASTAFEVMQLPDGPGAAVEGVDYLNNGNTPNFGVTHSATRMLSDGLSGANFNTVTVVPNLHTANSAADDVYVNIFDNTSQDGNRSAVLNLSTPSDSDHFFLGGENIPLGLALGRSSAAMNIIDNDTLHGTLVFSAPTYTVNENGTNVTITVARTNGSTGGVTVYFETSNGTAIAGSDYTSTNGTLSFFDGQHSKSFTIRITDDTAVESDKTINVSLSNPTGGATIGLTNAVVTIIDNDYPGGKLGFASATYTTNENSVSAVISVKRNGSSAGALNVYAIATNGTATAGADFTGVTNLLSWGNGDTTTKTFVVPLLDDPTIETNETVTLRLVSPTLNGATNQLSLGTVSNATLTILDNDFLGKVGFSTGIYLANENSGVANITVVRSGGSSESISVNFAAVNGTAIAGTDFVATNGTLVFGPGEVSKSFNVVINDNIETWPGTPYPFISLTLSGASPAAGLGNSAAIIYIVDDESVTEPPGEMDTTFDSSGGANDTITAMALQADGKILAGGEFTQVAGYGRNRVARFDTNGVLDQSFSMVAANAGANGKVNAIVCQTDGRVLIGGEFLQVTGAPRNRFARLNFNGSLDAGFDPGSGADAPVFALAESFAADGSRLIFLGGSFNNYKNVARRGLARLNNAGDMDTTFNPQLSASGGVYAIVPYPTNSVHAGKVLIAGDFTSASGALRAGLARLNSDGSVDLSFNPGTGASGAVRALALQADGRVLVGGSFTNFNGMPLNRLARLNDNGSIDGTFNIGAGADDTVLSIVVQGDTKIVVGGLFTHCNGVGRNRITRLKNDGTVDPTINFGAGANAAVAASLIQLDGKIVIGGSFTEYDGTPRQRIARIFGGSIAGSGSLEYTKANYQVSENATNAVLTVRRRGGTSGLIPGGSVTVDSISSDGTAVDGVNYIGGTSPLTFPEGEVFQNIVVPLIDDADANADRTANFSLANILPTGSAVIGNQPTTELTILNDDSTISFVQPTFVEAENSVNGAAVVGMVRSGATAETATVILTTTNGTAIAGLDYVAVSNLVTFLPGETNKLVAVPILNDSLIEANETVNLRLTDATGALLIGGPSLATLTIADDDAGPGQIGFATAAYAAGENGGNAIITLVRSNGTAGLVSVLVSTADVTANAGLDYIAQNQVPVAFGPGETSKTLLILISDDNFVEGNEVFNATLVGTTGGATILGTNIAPVTILDNDMGFSFSSPFYVASESGPTAVINVLRLGGSSGPASVYFSTTNVTASAGADYVGQANVLLSFANGEVQKNISVEMLEDTLVEGEETFGVRLSNPSPGLQLLNGSATVTIVDNDTGFSFGTNSFVVNEEATNLWVTVYRTNANTGPASVVLTASNLTAVAEDYFLEVTNAALNFTNGEALKLIPIQIVNDVLPEGDETFRLELLSPSAGAQLVGDVIATATIVDNDAGVRFSSANYIAHETNVSVTITVLREGFTNSTVAVNYATANGTAMAGTNSDYTATNGVFVFTNGETVKTFTVQILDDFLEEGLETVLLSLSSPTGQVDLISPSVATLTIVDNDGGSILSAGSRLTSESGIVNGAIEPGETVTVLFAMRNVSGVNTTNLVATLLATNGVSSPSGAQNYGILVNNGDSASRSFSFTANGTNGAVISPTFVVQEQVGDVSYGRVTFNYLLGSTSAVYSNTQPITINDNTMAAPYPSSITVTGLLGTVSKAVVTVSNIHHLSADDIDMLLVGPTGASTMLMSDAGGLTVNITNVALVFDDAAPGYLPDSTLITSGTYKPSNYGAADLMPSPAPAGPWGNTLAGFNSTDPNGLWSLYIYDDLVIYGGGITHGWRLTLTTLGTIPAASDLSVRMTATPAIVVQNSNITYSISVTNYGPWAATGIKLTNAVPAGSVYVGATTSIGSVTTNAAGQVVWTIGSFAVGGGATANVTVAVSSVGNMVTTATVDGVEADPNDFNNVASVTNLVVPPSADLSIAMVGTPNPLFITNNSILTYTISVANAGPSAATGIVVTNALPPEVTFLQASSGGIYANGVVTFTNLSLGVGGAPLTATITVRAVTPGLLSSEAGVSSSLDDPFKPDNTVNIKTLVNFPAVEFVRSGNNLVISWPAAAAGYVLETTTNLAAPMVWTPVTVPPPVMVGGVNYITNNIGSGNRFFRLRATSP